MEMTAIVYGVGLVLGSAMIVTVCAVYFRQQTVGAGGILLMVFGVVLVGLSVWSTVSVKATPGGGFEVELANLEKRVEQVEETSSVVADDLATVAENMEADREQFGTLTRQLAETRVLRPEAVDALTEPPTTRSRVDVGQLRELSAKQRAAGGG